MEEVTVSKAFLAYVGNKLYQFAGTLEFADTNVRNLMYSQCDRTSRQVTDYTRAIHTYSERIAGRIGDEENYTDHLYERLTREEGEVTASQGYMNFLFNKAAKFSQTVNVFCTKIRMQLNGRLTTANLGELSAKTISSLQELIGILDEEHHHNPEYEGVEKEEKFLYLLDRQQKIGLAYKHGR
jgi:hypothetical protein